LLGDAFQRDRDTYSLDRKRLRIDLDDLDRLRSQVEARTEEQEQASLESALALFRGGPLAGMEALWAAGEQRRLTALWGDLLGRVAQLRLESRDPAGALELAEAAAALDGSNEHPVQLAMEAEAALGRREAIVERYERLRGALDGQFGLEVSRDTKLLYRRLLGQDDSPRLSSTRLAQLACEQDVTSGRGPKD
ncbi:MAG TPA: bacterial transcriptional activator domain-containing protein, partial [Gaiellaceae bacterium]|nr:bacterial transcriptional activator domain-containing protein [Gaiellaceae bacterium]